jgi:hypothetical protein
MNFIKLFVVFILLLYQSKAEAQQVNNAINKPAKEIKLNICCGKDSFYMEFSSMADWKKANKILLIPQRPGERKIEQTYHKENKVKIVAIDKTKIREFIHNPNSRKAIPASDLDLINFDNCKTSSYAGIEAAVIKNDSVYFSIETKGTDSLCYVVSGILNKDRNTITMTGKKIFIPKPKEHYFNAGFESIAIWKQNKLLTIFEKNFLCDPAYEIDLSTNKYKPVSFKRALYFRITDACYYKKDTLLAINHSYKDDEGEFEYYIGNREQNIRSAYVQMFRHDPHKYSYTALIKIYPNRSADGLRWETFKLISFSDTNWEAILLFDKGFLLASDAVPSGPPKVTLCSISYFE